MKLNKYSCNTKLKFKKQYNLLLEMTIRKTIMNNEIEQITQNIKDDYYECWEKIFGLSKIQDNVIDITRVYPNPFSDVINISIDEDLQDLLELKVFDIIGNEVYSNIVDKISNDLTIKTLNLSKGIYILQLKYKNRISKLKLIKK